MNVDLRYSEKARKDLSDLNDKIREWIILKMEFFCFESSPMKHAKALSGDYQGLYRFRIGEYRVIFSKNAKDKISVLTILRIKHRKEVYS